MYCLIGYSVTFKCLLQRKYLVDVQINLQKYLLGDPLRFDQAMMIGLKT